VKNVGIALMLSSLFTRQMSLLIHENSCLIDAESELTLCSHHLNQTSSIAYQQVKGMCGQLLAPSHILDKVKQNNSDLK